MPKRAMLCCIAAHCACGRYCAYGLVGRFWRLMATPFCSIYYHSHPYHITFMYHQSSTAYGISQPPQRKTNGMYNTLPFILNIEHCHVFSVATHSHLLDYFTMAKRYLSFSPLRTHLQTFRRQHVAEVCSPQ